MCPNYMTDEDLLTNPSARIPVCLCIDTSGSMLACEGGEDTGETIVRDGVTYRVVTGDAVAVLDHVNNGLKEMVRSLQGNDQTRNSVDLSIILFDDTSRVYLPFTTISSLEDIPQIPYEEVHDMTIMSQGLRLALDTILARKRSYKENRVDYYQPQIVLFTDGETNVDDPIAPLQNEIRGLCANRKLTFIPINIETMTDEAREFLKGFGGKPPVYAKDIVGFFEWYSKSLVSISSSKPGESVPVDVDGIDSWGDW
ncbi:MAG: VWA domain-containing protein [Bacilli bacterium]|nr:VWA domain-containing protein [Bacilli bacterium]